MCWCASRPPCPPPNLAATQPRSMRCGPRWRGLTAKCAACSPTMSAYRPAPSRPNRRCTAPAMPNCRACLRPGPPAWCRPNVRLAKRSRCWPRGAQTSPRRSRSSTCCSRSPPSRSSARSIWYARRTRSAWRRAKLPQPRLAWPARRPEWPRRAPPPARPAATGWAARATNWSWPRLNWPRAKAPLWRWPTGSIAPQSARR